MWYLIASINNLCTLSYFEMNCIVKFHLCWTPCYGLKKRHSDLVNTKKVDGGDFDHQRALS